MEIAEARRKLLQAFKYPGNKQKVLELLPFVGDPREIVDPYDQNLLHFAGDRGWRDIIEKLIVDYHFDPHYEDELGGTVLGDVCARGHTDVARYLVREWCVDPTRKDKSGRSPLDQCEITENMETVACLRDIIDEAKCNGYEDVGHYLRAQKAQKALAKAMKSGGGELSQANVIMHGAPGAGKTSVKQLIAGLPPLPKEQQNATDIMERAVRTVCTNVLKEFKVINNIDLMKILAEEIRNQEIKEKDVSHKQTVSDSTIDIVSGDPLPKRGVLSTSSSDTVVPSSNATIQVGENVAEILEKLQLELLKNIKLSSSLFKSFWLHLIDSGGQPQFLDILPLVYSSPSLYIFVMRLTDGLDKKTPVRFYDEGELTHEMPNHLCLTNHEMIVSTCQIATGAASDNFTPMVMIVATYKDECGSQSGSMIKSINDGLSKERKQFENILICKAKEEIVFAINAVAHGDERQHYKAELQKCIMQNVKGMKIEPIKIPLKWLAYHLDLDKEKGAVKISACYEKGKAFDMSKADVRDTLQFLDLVALAMYLPKELPDVVLTRMEPFIGKLSKLVKASFVPQGSCPPGPADKLRRLGIFSKTFLRKILGNLKETDLTEDQFLELLLCLKIAVHVSGEDYFLPSALSLDPSPESTFDMESVPLAFIWDGRILPHGFFFTIVIEMLNKLTDQYSFELRADIDQWRNEIQIDEVYGKIPGVVKLTNRKSWIQVSYSDDISYCAEIFAVAKKAIRTSVMRFQHMGMDALPTIGFLCPLHCQSAEAPHYCTLTSRRDKVTCSVKKVKTGLSTSKMLCWITDINKTTKTSELACQDQLTLNDSVDKISSVDYRLPSSIDNTLLSLDDELAVVDAIQTVKKWQELGLNLGIKQYKLTDIHNESPQAIYTCRSKMVQEWLKTVPNPSWNMLAHALNSQLVGEHNLARRIADAHHADEQ